MKTAVNLIVAGAALAVATPTLAAPILNGAVGVMPTAGVPAGQGTLLASQSFTGQAFTFAGIFNQAVYRNAAGTLDFYYQVIRTGAGSLRDEEVRSFTVSNFGGYTVDGYASAADPDGAGIFIAANNPRLADGTLSGSTTTFGRAPLGNVLTTEFGANGLTGTENSATYIFRTNATNYNALGTFGIIDGSTLQGLTYQPIGAGVPEPASWALMLVGFGVAGVALRRRQSVKASVRLA